MYWFRSSVEFGPLLMATMLGIWLAGGLLLSLSSFRLRAHERPVVGFALGVTLSIWLTNIVGRWLSPQSAFWLSGLIILALGIIVAGFRRAQLAPALLRWQPWAVLGATAFLAVFLMLIGRGVGVFDDRKNLSYISTMAAGDIPPHFYMDPDLVPSYHYGFQLIGASFVQNAGMFPWSAFDAAKGLVGSLAIALAAMLGLRLTHTLLGAGLMALVVSFASGGRWLLLFLPQSLVREVSGQISMWGSAAASASSFAEALGSSWTIEGGPPVPIPFAFVSGILQPFILGLQAGPRAFSLMILFLVLIVLRAVRIPFGWTLIVAILASWALASEADFALYVIGLFAVAAVSRFLYPSSRWRPALRNTVLASSAAVIISAFQGGTLTEVGRGLMTGSGGVAGSGNLAGFSIRWPPAIVSSHLGELALRDVERLLAGIAEMGPALLAAPLAIWLSARWARRGRFELAGLGVASLAGVLIPLFLRFQVDRDITRLTAFGLLGWSMLALPGVFLLLRARHSGWVKLAFSTWLAVLSFGGVIVLGSLLTGLPRAVISTDIAPIDTRISDRFWGEMGKDGLILDSHPWRATAITGMATRSSPTSTATYPEWEQLVAEVDLVSARRSGYDFVYIDEYWWQRMGENGRSSFSQPCSILLGLEEDDQENGTRRLFDISGCD